MWLKPQLYLFNKHYVLRQCLCQRTIVHYESTHITLFLNEGFEWRSPHCSMSLNAVSRKKKEKIWCNTDRNVNRQLSQIDWGTELTFSYIFLQYAPFSYLLAASLPFGLHCIKFLYSFLNRQRSLTSTNRAMNWFTPEFSFMPLLAERWMVYFGAY